MYTREQLMEYTATSLVEYKKTLLYPFMRLRALLAQEYLDIIHEKDLGQKLLNQKLSKMGSSVIDPDEELKRILTILISQMNERIVSGVGVPSDVMPVIYNSIESLINPNRGANPIAPPVE